MNCKPGDLAIIVTGCDAGKTLTVLELLAPGSTPPGNADLPDDPQNRFAADLGHVWTTDRPIRWVADHQPAEDLACCPDAILRPITPDDDMRLAFDAEARREQAKPLATKLSVA